MEIENRTAATITPKERNEQRLWNAIALREAIINAMVHNDYTREIAPKFEIFADRFEITSAGSLPEGLSKDEFFEGYSVPRNKELMRVFKDLEMVEQLGSGVPRILEYYGKACFHFSENFLRMEFPASERVTESSTTQVTPQVTPHVTPHVTPQVEKLLNVIDDTHNSQELMEMLELVNRKYFRKSYLQPAVNAGLIELTIPDKPRSSKQQYRITEKGKQLRSSAMKLDKN